MNISSLNLSIYYLTISHGLGEKQLCKVAVKISLIHTHTNCSIVFIHSKEKAGATQTFIRNWMCNPNTAHMSMCTCEHTHIHMLVSLQKGSQFWYPAIRMILEDLMLSERRQASKDIYYMTPFIIGTQDSHVREDRGEWLLPWVWEEGNGSLSHNGYTDPVWKDEIILEMDSVTG